MKNIDLFLFYGISNPCELFNAKSCLNISSARQTDNSKLLDSLSLSLSLSLSPHLYHLSLLAGLLDCILCPYRGDVSYSLLVGNTGTSIREHDVGVVFTSPTGTRMSCSYYSDSFWDRRQVAVQMLFCWMFLLGFVQDSTYPPCVVDI